MKTFATEEEKNQAISEFDERTGSVNELQEIMDAEIKPVETEETTPPTSEGETTTEPMPDETSDETSVEKPTEADHSTPEDEKPDETALLREELAQKERFIKESLSNMDHLQALQEKVSTLEKSFADKASPEQRKEVRLRESKINDLKSRRSELARKYASPEDQLSDEYLKEMDAIQTGLFEEIEALQHNFSVMMDKTNTAISKADSFAEQRKQEEESRSVQESERRSLRELEEFSKNPKYSQFSLSKPFSEIDDDYKTWQTDVAKIYFGRPPQHIGEVNEAMSKMKSRSPYLVSKLKAAGVATEPNDEFKKYLDLCAIWDVKDGYRKDPNTGDYRRDKNGNILPLVRYEPTTGKYVPDTYPSFESAYNDQAVKTGLYNKKIVEAKIEGAKSAMDAINQRDRGATEIGSSEMAGGPIKAAEEAFERFVAIDEIQAIKMAQDGDPKLLDEYNQLAKILGCSQVENPIGM